MRSLTEENRIYGLVLAGGKSRRMGQDKALLRRDGRSQLALAFALLEQVTDRTFVSTRADQQHDAERGRFPQIVDHDDNIGPVAGILSAMQKFPNMDWLVVACDLPNLDLQTLTNLLAHRLDDSPFIAYRSSHDGLPEPLCAVYSQKAPGTLTLYWASPKPTPSRVCRIFSGATHFSTVSQ